MHRRSERSVWGVVVLLGLLLLVGAALSSCAGPQAIAAVEPTPTSFPPTPTDVPPPLPQPTPEALNFPLAPPKDVNLETPDDDACVKCHTDEEILKAVAEEDQDVQETLSEGEG
ncbi:MAG: hypothetical protein ACK2UC_09005 [Anaerolineae bacterium]|jgi:hypothetical protein